MQDKTRFILGGFIVTLAVAAGIYWIFRPSPILVETAQVVTASFQDTIEAEGRTRVRDRYVISAPLAGQLQRIALDAGDSVEAGQTLAVITPSVSPLLDPRLRLELQAQIGSAEAAVEEASSLYENAKVLLSQAAANLERTRQLVEQKVAPAAQLDRDRFLHESAQRQTSAAEGRWHAATHLLEQARAAVQSATNPERGENFKVTSPITGQILKVVQDSDTVVAVGAPLLELGDPRDLEIAVDVLSADAARIGVGDEVTIGRWGGPADLSGVVKRVEPSGFTKVSALGVEEQRVWVIIDITSPREQWASLGDGYGVDARIVVDKVDRATVVPAGALFRRGGAWNVFVVEEGEARLRQIRVAHISEAVASVADGLGAGETVVLYPPTALVDQAPVKMQ